MGGASVIERYHGGRRLLATVSCLMACFTPQAMATNVGVYGEGTYTANYLYMEVRADITDGSILSYGVKLSYDPSKLAVAFVTKNEDVWFFRDRLTNYPYANPDFSTPGEVVAIGAKVDTANPTAGVTGTAVLLGRVVFSRGSYDTPLSDPVAFFGLGLSLGKESPYDNFVTTGGVSLDSTGVDFRGIEILAGDSDVDGLTDDIDNCPTATNVDQLDDDGDGLGNACDNCILAANGPLVPDAGGMVQRDTDGDGFGNVCDGDLNNDNSTDTLDLQLYKGAHRSIEGDPDYDPNADFNGDGAVNTLDLNILKGLYLNSPGPSCCDT
jgi:hypothetical protein